MPDLKWAKAINLWGRQPLGFTRAAPVVVFQPAHSARSRAGCFLRQLLLGPIQDNGDHFALKLLLHGKAVGHAFHLDRKSTRLNSSHVSISYAVFCLKKKK